MITNDNLPEVTGESTDSKPTEGVLINTIFREIDTGDLYYYDGTAWELVGGNA